MTRKIVLLLLILVGIAGGIWGITGVYQLFTKGHGAVMNTTSEVPWGLQISAYVFLILISTGCSLVYFVGYLTNPKEYSIIGPG